MAQIVKIHFNGAFIWALPNRKEKLAQFLYEVILGQKANLKIKNSRIKGKSIYTTEIASGL